MDTGDGARTYHARRRGRSVSEATAVVHLIHSRLRRCRAFSVLGSLPEEGDCSSGGTRTCRGTRSVEHKRLLSRRRDLEKCEAPVLLYSRSREWKYQTISRAHHISNRAGPPFIEGGIFSCCSLSRLLRDKRRSVVSTRRRFRGEKFTHRRFRYLLQSTMEECSSVHRRSDGNVAARPRPTDRIPPAPDLEVNCPRARRGGPLLYSSVITPQLVTTARNDPRGR